MKWLVAAGGLGAMATGLAGFLGKPQTAVDLVGPVTGLFAGLVIVVFACALHVREEKKP